MHEEAKRRAHNARRLRHAVELQAAYVNDPDVRRREDEAGWERAAHKRFCEEQVQILHMSAMGVRDVKTAEDAIAKARQCMDAGVSYYDAASRFLDKAADLCAKETGAVPAPAVRQLKAGLLLLWNQSVACEGECTEALGDLLRDGSADAGGWTGALLQIRAACRDKSSTLDLMELDLDAAWKEHNARLLTDGADDGGGPDELTEATAPPSWFDANDSGASLLRIAASGA